MGDCEPAKHHFIAAKVLWKNITHTPGSSFVQQARLEVYTYIWQTYESSA